MSTRLSDLPDDLLHLILNFVPSREAASTAALSRGWRPLLPTPWCGAAVHLDTRSYKHHASFGSRRDAFFQAAKAALAAHESVKRLTIHVEDERYYAIGEFMFANTSRDHDIVDDVLSHPACRGLEVLRIEAYTGGNTVAGSKCNGESLPVTNIGCYDLSLGALPSQALRELHITNCSDLAAPPETASFPSLSVLRLQSCVVSLDCLQHMVVASPQLDTVHLDYVFIKTEVCCQAGDEDAWHVNNNTVCHPEVQSFCCPTISVLLLANCAYDNDNFTIEMDVPRVRHFRYNGNVDKLLLRSAPPDLARVDLHVFDSRKCTLFWHFLMNFQNTKALKLKLVCPIEDIAVPDKKKHDKLVGEMLFNNLELLEVNGKHKTVRKDAAVAIGNLLQCCPALVDLRLKLQTVDEQPDTDRSRRRHLVSYWGSLEREEKMLNRRKAQLDFCKSICHFLHRRDHVISFGGYDEQYDASDVPGLSDKWFNFNCLQFYLKRVSLQFRLEKSNGFAVQLAKFFCEKAMVLEEMYIDDGKHKMCQHVNLMVGGPNTDPLHPRSEYKVSPGISHKVGVKSFISSSKICKQFPNNCKYDIRRRNSWSSGFTILPLER